MNDVPSQASSPAPEDAEALARLRARLRALAAVFLLAYGAFYVGLWFHRSVRPSVFGAYSPGYLALLAALATPLALPWLLGRLSRRHGPKAVLFVLTPLAFVVGVAWVAGHIIYDYTRQYPFDPYLQLFSEPLEAQHPVAKAPGTIRVLALGGSTTRNHRLAPPDRYPRQLEGLLRAARPGAKIEVVNAGQNWWTTKHSLVNYVTYARDWRPDVVVVMHAINDLEKSRSNPDFTIGDYDPKWTHHYASAGRAARAPTFEQWLAQHLRSIGYKWFSRFRFRSVDYPLEDWRSRDAFAANLKRIVHYARSDGAEVLLVTQPSVYRGDLTPDEQAELQAPKYMREPDGWLRMRSPSIASLQGAMAGFNDSTRAVASAEGVRLVEGARAVPKTFEHFIDEVHYTPKGARALAEAVAEGVLATRPFTRTSSSSVAASPPPPAAAE